MRPQVVVEWAKSYLMEFIKAQEESKFSGSKELIGQWHPPEQGLLNINVEAARTPEEVGLGVIVRDDDGQIMAAFEERSGKTSSAELSEILAVIKGSAWTKEVGMDVDA